MTNECDAVKRSTEDELRSELARMTAERDYLKRRETSIIEAVSPVCDGGQCRADIVSAVQRVRRERDALRDATGELDGSVAYGWAYQALRCLDGSGAELHRVQSALDAVAAAVREAWAHRGRATLYEFPGLMPTTDGIWSDVEVKPCA